MAESGAAARSRCCGYPIAAHGDCTNCGRQALRDRMPITWRQDLIRDRYLLEPDQPTPNSLDLQRARIGDSAEQLGREMAAEFSRLMPRCWNCRSPKKLGEKSCRACGWPGD